MIKLDLPYPVSANRYWRSFASKSTGRCITVVSPEAKSYKNEVGWLAREAGMREPMTGAIALDMWLTPKNRICMDLDNALKVMIDALKGVAYADDSQIEAITAAKLPPGKPGMLVWLRQL